MDLTGITEETRKKIWDVLKCDQDRFRDQRFRAAFYSKDLEVAVERLLVLADQGSGLHPKDRPLDSTLASVILARIQYIRDGRA